MIKEDRGVEFDINGERSSEPSSGLNLRARVGGRSQEHAGHAHCLRCGRLPEHGLFEA